MPAPLRSLADGADGRARDAADHGNEEQGTDQQPPERPPSRPAPRLLVSLHGAGPRGADRPRHHSMVEQLDQAFRLGPLEGRSGPLRAIGTVELPHREGGHTIPFIEMPAMSPWGRCPPPAGDGRPSCRTNVPALRWYQGNTSSATGPHPSGVRSLSLCCATLSQSADHSARRCPRLSGRGEGDRTGASVRAGPSTFTPPPAHPTWPPERKTCRDDKERLHRG